MKATGIVYRIDDLGRIVIPKEIRRQVFGTEKTEGLPLEILIDGDTVVLKEYKVEMSDSEKIDFAVKELERLQEHCYAINPDQISTSRFSGCLQNIIDNLKA